METTKKFKLADLCETIMSAWADTNTQATKEEINGAESLRDKVKLARLNEADEGT